MALSLGVRAGSKIKIAESMLEVLKVVPGEIDIVVNGNTFTITDAERQQVMPEVYVSCGPQNIKNPPDYGKLAIEAPRRFAIIRTNAKRKDVSSSAQG